jgi:hypothetical protein
MWWSWYVTVQGHLSFVRRETKRSASRLERYARKFPIYRVSLQPTGHPASEIQVISQPFSQSAIMWVIQSFSHPPLQSVGHCESSRLSVSQSISHSVSRLAIQSISQPSFESSRHSGSQWVSQSAILLIIQPFSQSISRAVSQSFSQPAIQAISRSVSEPFCESSSHSVGGLVSQSVN